MTRAIAVWESEGGAASPTPFIGATTTLTGTPNQVEWAEIIRRQVHLEFDRVAAAFRSVIRNQSEEKHHDTEAVLAILEDKREEVLSRGQAGYFIHDWQEINDQVRQMIADDARYQALKSIRIARRG